MKKYYDAGIGSDFERQIVSLKESLRSKPFNAETSNYGVAGNTFRAFTGYSTPPSLVYREWAKQKTKLIFQSSSVTNFENQAAFDQWHNALFEDIVEYWNSKQNKPLSYAHTFKLVDLYLKWLSSNQNCPENLINSLINFGYCALDSQILIYLNKCLSGALPIYKPSMGDIQNKNTYDFCQSLIKDFTEHFGGTRLLFDYYAWQAGGAKLFG